MLKLRPLQIVVGRTGTETLTNEAGEVTRSAFTLELLGNLSGTSRDVSVFLLFVLSHLQGMFTRTIRLLEAGIKPVCVEDSQGLLLCPLTHFFTYAPGMFSTGSHQS